MTQHYRGSPLVIALAGALLLGACGKQEPAAPPPPKAAPPAATPAPAPPPVAAPAPAAAPVTTVTSVTLGNAIGGDGKVAASSTVFAPKDTIYASVATNSSGGGSASIAAKWTFGEGTPVSSSEQKIEANGPATTTFHISKPDGWPVGKYAVAISVDGKPTAATTTFEVK